MRYLKLKASDNKFYSIKLKKFRFRCCDCKLVHIMNFKVVNKRRIEVQTFRDNRATNYARNRLKKVEQKILNDPHAK